MILALLVPLSAYTLPPLKYQGDITIVATFAKPELVRELCGRRNELGLIACATSFPPSMIVPNACHYPDQSYARTICHELGHTNGWNYEHKEEK